MSVVSYTHDGFASALSGLLDFRISFANSVKCISLLKVIEEDGRTPKATGKFIPHLDEGVKEDRMNRRAFLIRGVLVTLGLTALPAVSALAKLPVALGTKQEDVPACLATEAEAIDDILDYVDAWDEDLPGHDFRELLLRRLVTEKTGMSYSEFSNHYWKHADKAKGT